MLDIIRLVLSWIALVLVMVPIFYIFILSIAALKPIKRQRLANNTTKIAIVIPAHNEALLIAQTIHNVLPQDYPNALYQLFVIADNCTDDTAKLAQASGATVIERQHNPGKGQALLHAFNQLLKEDWDAFLVIDADSSLNKSALKAINCELLAGAKVIQCLDSILNPDINNRTRSMQLGMASFNGLRPRGRMALGLSCGFFGNGFCLSRAVLLEVPYLAHSIVEDLEYHILLLQKNYKVILVDDAIAAAQAPLAAKDSATQRSRWEIGKLLMIKQYSSVLFKQALQGKRWAWEAISEVMMPPSSLIVLCCFIPLLLGFTLERWLALTLLLIMSVHYGIASLYYGSFHNFLRLCFYVPWYILWKTKVVLTSLTQMQSLKWVRTQRHSNKKPDKKP